MEVDFLILTLILILFILLILTVAYFLWYSGLFISIDIKTCKPPFKSLEVAYKFAKGAYKDCGSLFTEAHSIAPGLRCIGMYYDSPDENFGRPMRYIIGLILNDTGMEADDQTRSLMLFKGFKIAKFPEVDHVVMASFPHRTSVSVVIAPNKVLPKFNSYVKENKLLAYPMIEICDGKEIIYASPLTKQDEFLVPEALAESEDDQRTIDDEWSAREDEFDPDSLIEGSIGDDIPSAEIIDSLGDNGHGLTNGSEASTESFEELQLDS